MEVSAVEKLETITNLNKEILEFVRFKIYNLSFYNESISSDVKSELHLECTRLLIEMLEWDTKFNSKALKLYKVLEKLNSDLEK